MYKYVANESRSYSVFAVCGNGAQKNNFIHSNACSFETMQSRRQQQPVKQPTTPTKTKQKIRFASRFFTIVPTVLSRRSYLLYIILVAKCKVILFITVIYSNGEKMNAKQLLLSAAAAAAAASESPCNVVCIVNSNEIGRSLAN